MNKTTTLLILAILVAAPLTGCIENMDDLKDRLNAASNDETEPTETAAGNLTNETGNVTGNATNTTEREFKPPVARITVYAPGGALLYKSSFAAEDQLDPVAGEQGTYSLLAADSEALDSTARLDKFEWVVDGEALEGRKVDVNLSKPGIHMIVLTVTDTNGKTDSQMVHVGVMPEPFDVVTPFTGDAMAGFDPDPEVPAPGAHEITISETVDGKTVSLTKFKAWVQMNKHAGTTATATPWLRLYDAAGNEVASAGDFGSISGYAEIALDTLAPGTYTLDVRVDGATDGYAGEFVLTYLEQIEGLGGDGHGGHAH